MLDRLGRKLNKRHPRKMYLDLYNQGVLPLVIAEKLGVTPAAVYNHLRQSGIDFPRTKKLHTKDFPKAVEMYRSGMSLAEVASYFGMTDECLRRRFVKERIPRRSLKDSVPRGEKNRFYYGGITQRNRSSRNKEPRRMSWQIAAICLGHPLPNDWIVHHEDNNPSHNNPDNIWIFPDRESHTRYHAELTRCRYKGLAVDASHLASKNGAVKLPRPPAPIVFSPDTNPRDLFEKLKKRVSDQTT